MSGATPFDPATYTKELSRHWDEASSHYARLSAEHFPAVSEAFVRFAAPRPGQRILDLACGPATITGLIARRVGPSGRVEGVDLSPAMVALAGRKTEREGLSNASFRQGNAEELDCPDGSFDGLLCQLGLMLFARPDRALDEMARVTRPGGRVACLVQGRGEEMIFTSLIMRCTLKHAPQLKIPGAPALYAFGPPGLLKKAFSRAGLIDVACRRLRGTFAFASPEAYWETMARAGGRMRSFLGELPKKIRKAIRQDVLSEAKAYESHGLLAVPYEFVMARGAKPYDKIRP